MGFLPSWNQQDSFQQANLGQHSLFTNPNMQQSKPMQLANMLRQPSMQPQIPQQPNPMQPQPYQAGIQPNMMGDPTNQMGQNWGSQYGSN